MKTLDDRNENFGYTYSYDVDKIVEAYKDNGYDITRQQAYNIWSEYSDGMCAGWIHLPETLYEIYCNSKYEMDKLYISKD